MSDPIRDMLVARILGASQSEPEGPALSFDAIIAESNEMIDKVGAGSPMAWALTAYSSFRQRGLEHHSIMGIIGTMVKALYESALGTRAQPSQSITDKGGALTKDFQALLQDVLQRMCPGFGFVTILIDRDSRDGGVNIFSNFEKGEQTELLLRLAYENYKKAVVT